MMLGLDLQSSSLPCRPKNKLPPDIYLTYFQNENPRIKRNDQAPISYEMNAND